MYIKYIVQNENEIIFEPMSTILLPKQEPNNSNNNWHANIGGEIFPGPYS